MSVTHRILAAVGSDHPSGKIIGHRGESGRMPENTMSAFEEAWRQGADLIEFDVRRSRDGELVISHDPTVDRCTDGHGAIADLTFEQLRALDAGAKQGRPGEHIPTLREVLAWSADKIDVNIHINNSDYNDTTGAYPGMEKQVVDTVRALHLEKNVFLSSFSRSAIEAVKRDNPDLACGLLISARRLRRMAKIGTAVGVTAGLMGAGALSLGLPLWIGAAAAVGGAVSGAAVGAGLGAWIGRAQAHQHARGAAVDAFCPVWSVVTRKFVDEAHARGMPVYPYTVNRPSMVKRFTQQWGVDGVITDHPSQYAAPAARRSEG